MLSTCNKIPFGYDNFVFFCFQGMLWAYALLTAIKPPTVIEPVITTTVINVSTTVLPNLSGLLNSVSIVLQR